MKNYAWLLPLLLIGAAVAVYIHWPRMRKAASSSTAATGGTATAAHDRPYATNPDGSPNYSRYSDGGYVPLT